jgi:hypothetical protein
MLDNKLIHHRIAMSILKQYKQIPIMNFTGTGDIHYIKLGSVRSHYDIVNKQPTYYFTLKGIYRKDEINYAFYFLNKIIMCLPHKPKIVIL